MSPASLRASAATAGIALLAVTCCVGAPLLAAGGLAVVDATFLRAWPLAIGVVVAIALFAVWRAKQQEPNESNYLNGSHADVALVETKT